MSEVLSEHLEDGVLTLTLNRPAQRNALSAELRQRLGEATRAAAANPAVGVVLLCAAGAHFCAGGDVKDMADTRLTVADAAARSESLRRDMEAVRWLHQMAKPTIAVINGAAAGAGLALALACDLRLAGRSARFTTAFARIGLAGDYGGSYFLSRLVGTAKARELYYTSPLLDAAEALGLGLVSRVVDDDALPTAAREMARTLAQGPRVALGYMKQNLDLAEGGTLADCLDAEAKRHVASALTLDHREAALAFVEKRPPIFRGH